METLVEVVEAFTSAGDEDEERISVESIFEAVGRRAFGPLLLVPGLIVLSPISGIPGVPTMGAIAVLLVAGQMLLGRDTAWLPGFLLRRSIRRDRMRKARRFLLPIARFMDKITRPRLSFLTERPFSYGVAGTCVLIALLMPPLEAILFANVITSAAISAFGLSLVAHDGLLALIAFILTGVGIFLGILGLI